MLTTDTLQDAVQGDIQSELEGSPDDAICPGNNDAGAATGRAQRGKRLRSPEIESMAGVADVSEMAIVEHENPRPTKKHQTEDVRDEPQ